MFSLSGDIRYNYTSVHSVCSFGNRNLIGNLNANIYVGDFSLSPYVNFRNKIVNTTSLGIEETPVNYGLECTYGKGNFLRKSMSCLRLPTGSFEKRSTMTSMHMIRTKISGQTVSIATSN